MVWSQELDRVSCGKTRAAPRPGPWRRGGRGGITCQEGRGPGGQSPARETADCALNQPGGRDGPCSRGAALCRASPSSRGRLAAFLPFFLICDICSELVPPVIRTPRSCADLRLRAGARGALSIRPF